MKVGKASLKLRGKVVTTGKEILVTDEFVINVFKISFSISFDINLCTEHIPRFIIPTNYSEFFTRVAVSSFNIPFPVSFIIISV